MQIFKCINNYKKKSKPAQNLIEFVFVFPMLIFMTLIIFEIAFFWQETNAIYNLNEEINANVAILDYSNMTWNSRCPAATTAINLFKKKDDMISLSDATYNDSAAINDAGLVVNGKEPFALYKYTSDKLINGQVDSDGNTMHQVTIWVDCRNPFEDGITTQIEFFHKTMIMKATLPRFDKPQGIVIIPDSIFISSPKLNTIRHY